MLRMKERQPEIRHPTVFIELELHGKILHLPIKRLHDNHALLLQHAVCPTPNGRILLLVCHHIAHPSTTAAPRRLQHTIARRSHQPDEHLLVRTATALSHQQRRRYSLTHVSKKGYRLLATGKPPDFQEPLLRWQQTDGNPG